MWGRIYNANFSSIPNPDLIYPREELLIPDIRELLIPYRTPSVTVQDIAQPAPAAPVSREAAAAVPAQLRHTARRAAREELENGDGNGLSEEMPEDMKEWPAGVKVAPDNWREDGVVSAKLKNDDPFLEDGMSVAGAQLEISMALPGIVRPGDKLTVYMRGTELYDDDGSYRGRELQPVGTAEVSSVEGLTVKARVIDATTAILKGYVVKKK